MRSSAYSLAIALLFSQLCGCMAAGGKRTARVATDHDSLRTARPVDPWSLGPDVFAQADIRRIASDSSIAQAASSNEQSISPSDTAAVLAAVSVKLSCRTRSILCRSSFRCRSSPCSLVHFSIERERRSFTTAQSRKWVCRVRSNPIGRSSGCVFGKFTTRESADSLQMAAMKHGFYDARVVKLKLQP